eukprot:2569130-Rhodomonas_salina.1
MKLAAESPPGSPGVRVVSPTSNSSPPMSPQSELVLSPRSEEYARHIGINLESEEDKVHAWIAQQAVREPLPDGWSQHEDEDGYLYFYDAILDKSLWEHPLEGRWRRKLVDERRRVARKKELSDLQEEIANIAQSEKGNELIKDLKAKYPRCRHARVAMPGADIAFAAASLCAPRSRRCRWLSGKSGRTRETMRALRCAAALLSSLSARALGADARAAHSARRCCSDSKSA